MPSQTRSPSTAVEQNGSGTEPWAGESNVVSSNNSYATASLSGAFNRTEDIYASGFGFTIPSGATIQGFQVNVERKFSTSDAMALFSRVTKDGTTDHTLSPSEGFASYTADTYESTPTDDAEDNLGGTTWTPSEVNNSGFGALVNAVLSGSGGSGTVSIDHIEITVFYQEAVTGTTSASMPSLVAAVAAVHSQSGTLAGILPSVTAAFTGGVSISGSVATSLPSMVAALAGAQPFVGSVAVTLPAVMASASGSMQPSGTIAVSLPSLAASFLGEGIAVGPIAATLPAMTASLVGQTPPTGSVEAQLPSMIGALAGSQVYSAVMAMTLPSLVASLGQGAPDARYPHAGVSSTVVTSPGHGAGGSVPLAGRGHREK